ncbi:reactive intermediate/imine deaminase [Mesorhizobium sp. Root157]|jgi:reactive intermediate/imine deaminase|uniref:RidA family protein n=1 Tax=Mesorhizobium sp. Root157 TaxID=1736477 RepID=UPI0006FCABB6|nr:RidA family protein [Mesorhizobium sp. Root157]KQZ95824.1 reactive intermediate/imine deaminase [Mesorhizobium sp. Root157]
MTQIVPVFTDNAPIPLGHYSQAVRAGGFIHVSGQLPIKTESPPVSSNDAFGEQAQLVLRNLLAVLDAAGAAPSRVVKVTAYIVGVEYWSSFNAAFAEAFGEARPARSVVPVPELHHGFLIELDAIALDSDPSSAD